MNTNFTTEQLEKMSSEELGLLASHIKDILDSRSEISLKDFRSNNEFKNLKEVPWRMSRLMLYKELDYSYVSKRSIRGIDSWFYKYIGSELWNIFERQYDCENFDIAEIQLKNLPLWSRKQKE
jgi:hypothetical protein